MRPTISVVIPAFNAEETVERCLESVGAQDDPPDEVILVDDGSSDATTRVVERFGGGIQLIRQENQGAAGARQTGTEAARSGHVAYLDADDWWPAGKIGRCRALLQRRDVALLIADLDRARPETPSETWGRNSSFFPWARSYLEGREVEGEPALYYLPTETSVELLLRGFPVFPSTMLARRRAVLEAGGWNTRFRRCQDFDVALRVARLHGLFYLDRVEAVLGIHAVNEDALAYVLKQSQGDIRVLEAHLTDPAFPSDYRQSVHRALGRRLCNLGYSQRKAGDRASARQSYRKAMGFRGSRLHACLRYALLTIS